MKWLKHLSKSRNDAFMRDAITLFGLAGEHVYWRTMEVMADEFDIKKPGYNKFLVKSWIKNYETSVKKTIKILSFFHNYSDKKKRIFFKIRGIGNTQTIQLNCPKLKMMCDNWTTKMLKKTPKLLRSCDEPPSRKEVEEEEEYKRFLSDSPEIRLSNLLYNLMLKNNSNVKKPNFQTWAKNIDLMIRIDKRSLDDIEKTIKWCQKDDFWHTNILSTAKLRKQFDQLSLKMGGKISSEKKTEKVYV